MPDFQNRTCVRTSLVGKEVDLQLIQEVSCSILFFTPTIWEKTCLWRPSMKVIKYWRRHLAPYGAPKARTSHPTRWQVGDV